MRGGGFGFVRASRAIARRLCFQPLKILDDRAIQVDARCDRHVGEFEAAVYVFEHTEVGQQVTVADGNVPFLVEVHVADELLDALRMFGKFGAVVARRGGDWASCAARWVCRR